MTVFRLAGVFAEPEIWRMAAPGAVARPVTIEGLGLRPSAHGPFALPVAGQGATPGIELTVPSEEAAALAFLLSGFGLAEREGLWLAPGAEAPAPEGEGARPVLVALAEDILALRGQVAPEALARRLGPMLVRAASRLRARAEPGAHRLRRATGPEDVAEVALRQPYGHFFATEERDLSWRRFDGGMSAVATRAAFLSGDAVTVLPYDPVRDRVLLVEQFRAGPLARGDRQLWQLEAIAGRVDPFETPEEAARREAVEEAGLTLTELRLVARYYPSPGAVSEYIYSYLALTDLPDGAAGIFGLAEEAEDIRGHLVAFSDLMSLVESGEIDNAPLALTALWLQRERPRLR